MRSQHSICLLDHRGQVLKEELLANSRETFHVTSIGKRRHVVENFFGRITIPPREGYTASIPCQGGF